MARPLSSTRKGSEIVYLSNNETYNLWASTYDTDGNILQAIDDHELRTHLFPLLLDDPSVRTSSTLNVIDLGAGTGRASSALLSTVAARSPSFSRSFALHLIDASGAMLALATPKLQPLIATLKQNTKTTVYVSQDISDISPSSLPRHLTTAPADLIFSTLVLEHIPLATFFAALAALLKPGGLALVTNMHPDMGNTAVHARYGAAGGGSEAATGAGFVDEAGRKVRAEVDFAHGVEETLDAARGEGLEVVDVWERAVEEGLIGEGKVLGERGRKWIGTRVWYGVLLRKSQGNA